MTALPGYICPETFAAFVEMRQALKGIPFTPRAQLLIVKKLMRFHGDGFDPNAALEKSTIQGWRDIYPNDKLLTKKNQEDPELARLKAHKGSPLTQETRDRLAELRKPRSTV